MAGSSADAMARPPSSMTSASPRLTRSRTHSISSDRPSTIGHSLISPPLSVSPEAAFIASSAASQIVTNDHDSHADTWYDESGMLPVGETALVSYPALQLVNNFLDQLLFSFLQVAKATTLTALRPAVAEVLKPKLAKDAINNADEELHEYLGGGDEEDYAQPRGAEPGRDWDLELVWKRTRLRCMVYSSLGDMEEEDEDIYMEQENLEIGADEQISDVISPAVAIFLTSVLEYMGELTLTVAGQAAYHRMRASYEKELKEGTRDASDIADRIVVEDGDMERVALDRTLGRLWRGWKKRIRSPAIMGIGNRPFSRSSVGHLRHGSNATDMIAKAAASDAGSEFKPTPDLTQEQFPGEAGSDVAKGPDAAPAAALEQAEPFDIPLPMGENDVDEIEVPGLAFNSDDDEDEEDEENSRPQRPKSFFGSTIPIDGEIPNSGLSHLVRHKRSVSSPAPRSSRFVPPAAQTEVVDVRTPSSDEEGKEVFQEAFEQPGEDSVESHVAAVAGDAPAPVREKAGKRPKSKIIGKDVDNDTAIIGAARTTDEMNGQSDPESEYEVGTYEKAEIVTSSRVSVASSSLSASEGGNRRTNSVQSAQIVDVPAQKSSGSRSPSMDATERYHRRSVSASRASHSPSPPNVEEPRKPRAVENVARTAAATSSLRSSLDRVRPSLQNASIISESEEEGDMEMGQIDESNASFILASSNLADSSPPTTNRQSTKSQPARKSSLSRPQQAPSNTKVTILNTSNSPGAFIDEPIPEVPARAPGRHSTKPEAGLTRERTRTKDSEDTPSFPIQSNSPRGRTHTSGSSSSSVTGRFKAMRTSEEHVASHAENVARNFEELIQSNQTITYTLTPESMRDMDSPRSADSPAMSKFPRGKEGESKNQDRSRSSSTATEVKGTSSNRMVAVGSHSPETKDQKPSPISVPGPSTVSISKSPGLKSPTPKSPGSKSSRVPAGLARDARVPTDSTADFAEFIKSTGPPGDKQPPPPSLNNGSISNKTSLDSRRVSTTSKSRHQPRDAAVDAKADNSDLIDFIRQGPPGASTNPRIPRHVAPFRNTMDSTHTVGASGGRAVDATIPEVRNSQASTSVTETSMPSVQSSVNSSAALIKNKGQSTQNNNKVLDDEDMMPKRKTRRVRDPYAIDFSDEEDDDLLMTPQPPAKKEESLAEFLRNYQPPPEPEEPPVSQKMPKKKASAPSLMGRFSRAGFGRDFIRDRESKGTADAPNKKPGPDSRSLNSRTGAANNSAAKSGHIPIQVSMPPGYDKYGPVDSSAGRPRVASAAGSAGRVPMKKFEPRDATPAMSRTGTADLAAFLRDSEPPPSSMAPPIQAGTPDETTGFSKMFARRKKPVI